MNYTWNKEKIEKANIDDKVKKIMLNEIKGNSLTTDPSLYSKNITNLKEFKRKYKQEKTHALKTDKQMTIDTLNMYRQFPHNIMKYYTFNQEEIKPSQLIEIVHSFFKGLNNQNIMQCIDNLLTRKRDHIMFRKKEDNPILAEEIHGRCFSINNNEDAYISLYLYQDVTDFTCLIHELGHYLKHILYGNRTNPLLVDILTEIESNYFELLAIYYIEDKLNQPLISATLESNKINYTIDNIWQIKIQELLTQNWSSKLNIEKINKKLQKIPGSISIKEQDYISCTRLPLFMRITELNAFLIALELFDITKKDLENGLYIYEKLMLSKETTIEELLNKHPVNFKDNNYALLHSYREKAKKLEINTL